MSDQPTPADGDEQQSNPASPVTPPTRSADQDPTRKEPRPGLSLRSRAALVGIATAIVALSGVSGYALGTVSDGTDEVGLVGNTTDGSRGRIPGTPPGFGDGVPPGADGTGPGSRPDDDWDTSPDDDGSTT